MKNNLNKNNFFLSVFPKSALEPAEITAPLKNFFGVNLGTKLLWEGFLLFLPYFDIYIHFFPEISHKFLPKFWVARPTKKSKKYQKKGKRYLFVYFFFVVLMWVSSINIFFVPLIRGSSRTTLAFRETEKFLLFFFL